MLAVKVYLGGEGNCELGGRADGNERPGAVEALLRRLELSGWIVGGALRWQRIRKFRVGAGFRGDANHQDIHNVCGLVLHAFEAGCEVVAFVRDVDADDRRAAAIAFGVDVAAEKFPLVVVIGGVASPALEGWILALRGIRDTDAMSRVRTLDRLRELGIATKQPEAYVEIIEAADLDAIPVGATSLTDWLALARERLGAAVHGTSRA